MSMYFLAWKKYTHFDGRSTRTEFWMFTLFDYLIIIGLYALAFLLGGFDLDSPEAETTYSPVFFVIAAYFLATVLPRLALTVRRLHDSGRSGFWVFINMVPYLGSLVLFILLLQGSQEGDNEYGPSSRDFAEVFE